MASRIRLVIALWAATVGLGLLAAVPATATVTSSSLSVSQPPASSYLIDNQVTGDEQISVGGTTNGRSGDTVDLKCYAGSGSQTLAASVPVAADGTFQYTGSFRIISRQTCVLRAVPSGEDTDYPPGGSSPYGGPVLNLGQATETTVATGPNTGKPEYYYLYNSQTTGAFEYASLGGCSISESYTYDPTTFGGLSEAANQSLDYCNAWFSWKNGYTGTPGIAPPTRSELQVDGVDAYVAGNAWSLNGQNTFDNSGFPSLAYSYSVDPSTGDLSLNETDQVVRCSPGGVYPPTSSSCSSFVPTGVQVTMHIVQDQAGRVATVVQSFSSTDGAAHHVDLLENNDFYHRDEDGALDFPWMGAGMQPYTTVGQVLPGPSSPGPGAFFVKGSTSTPDGNETSPQGEITFSDPPSSETIVGTTNNSQHFSWVELHYALTVGPTGSVPLGFTYSNSYGFGQVASDAAAAAAAFRPTLALNAPQSGVDTAQHTVTVSGLAADANGLSSVTVNGRATAIGAGGSWSAPVSLAPGVNTVTVVAANVFGNTAQKQTTVVYVPPPSLSAIKQAHHRWREPGRRAKRRRPEAPAGTSFAYTLNEPAQVRFVFTEQLPGRKTGRSCVAQNRRNRQRPACRRMVELGSHTVSAGAGSHRLNFAGVLPNGRRLRAGSYTVTITATTPSTGARSSAVHMRFTIVG